MAEILNRRQSIKELVKSKSFMGQSAFRAPSPQKKPNTPVKQRKRRESQLFISQCLHKNNQDQQEEREKQYLEQLEQQQNSENQRKKVLFKFGSMFAQSEIFKNSLEKSLKKPMYSSSLVSTPQNKKLLKNNSNSSLFTQISSENQNYFGLNPIEIKKQEQKQVYNTPRKLVKNYNKGKKILEEQETVTSFSTMSENKSTPTQISPLTSKNDGLEEENPDNKQFINFMQRKLKPVIDRNSGKKSERGSKKTLKFLISEEELPSSSECNLNNEDKKQKIKQQFLKELEEAEIAESSLKIDPKKKKQMKQQQIHELSQKIEETIQQQKKSQVFQRNRPLRFYSQLILNSNNKAKSNSNHIAIEEQQQQNEEQLQAYQLKNTFDNSLRRRSTFCLQQQQLPGFNMMGSSSGGSTPSIVSSGFGQLKKKKSFQFPEIQEEKSPLYKAQYQSQQQQPSQQATYVRTIDGMDQSRKKSVIASEFRKVLYKQSNSEQYHKNQ